MRLRASATLAILSCVACNPLRSPSFPAARAESIGSTVSRADAIADLDTLLGTLESVHPDLYAIRPRDSVAAAKQRLVAELPASMSRSDWWIRLSPLVAAFGDGHTNVSYPGEDVLREMQAGALIFPPSVAVGDEGHLVVTAPFGARGLARNDRIATINDRDADSLVAAWMRKFSGESDIFRRTMVTDAFRDLVHLHGIRAPYSATVRSGAGDRSLLIDGITRDSLLAQVRGRGTAAPAASPNIAYRTLGPGIGYVNFRSMGGDMSRFRTDLAVMFRQVATDSNKTLLIDLRTNGGGDSRFGDEMLRYFNTTPYRMASRKEWKMSAEYRAYVKSLVRPPLGVLPIWYFFSAGRQMFGGPDGKLAIFDEGVTTPERAEPFFAGAVCVLIGPRTFSSAVDFADAIKTYRLATLYGEETGGRPNSFGEVYFFRLPRSQLGVSVSSARFVRANGDTTDHRGIIPDVEVRVSAADRQAGRDPVIERARSCSRL